MNNWDEYESLEIEISEMLSNLNPNANLHTEEEHVKLWALINKQSSLIALIKDKIRE